MRGFRQFLMEVARDDKRAKKLGRYLAKRAAKRTNAPRGFRKTIYFKKFKAGDDDAVTDSPKAKEVGFDAPKGKPTTLNTKSLIPSQHGTDFTRWGAWKKFRDKRPIRVLKTKDGKHRIADGHHRYFAARLRGHKTMQAHVTDEGDE